MARRLSARGLGRSRVLALALAFAATALAGLDPAASEACINGVEVQIDPRVQMLANAEADAAEGRILDALAATELAFPGRGPAKSPLHERALVVTAKAIARSEGRYGPGGKAAADEAIRAENLTFAASVLEARLQKLPSDAASRTDLAEALSMLPARRKEAALMLGELEQRNVMASAHGYRALAKVRKEAGQGKPGWLAAPLAAFAAAPREMALARCERMATTKDVCRA